MVRSFTCLHAVLICVVFQWVFTPTHWWQECGTFPSRPFTVKYHLWKFGESPCFHTICTRKTLQLPNCVTTVRPAWVLVTLSSTNHLHPIVHGLLPSLTFHNQLTLGVKPGTSRSVSLHRTTPSLRDVFRNSSGSAMFFFGELSTPSDINHVTVCSSGFMAPKYSHCLLSTQGIARKTKSSVSTCNSHPHFYKLPKKKKRGRGGTDEALAKLMITPTGK